jgi:hypothetical protein
MIPQALEQLLNESENPCLDFKQAQYVFFNASDDDKSELLKDILAFANASRKTDAYIIIGAEEVKGERAKIHGVNQHFDDASIQQFVNCKTERAIDFSVETVSVDQKKLDIIRIPVQRRPFYLKNDYGKLKAKTVYFRQGTATAVATPNDIARMVTEDVQPTQREPALEAQFAQHIHALFGSASVEEVGTRIALSLKSFDYKLIQPADFWSTLGKPPDKLKEANEFFHRLNCLSTMAATRGFAVRNLGAIPALNVELLVEIPKDSGLWVGTQDQVNFSSANLMETLSGKSPSKNFNLTARGNYLEVRIHLGRILPDYTAFASEDLYFGATKAGNWRMKTVVYADNLSAPKETELFMDVVLND